jgi:hypothetical protein
VIEYKVVGKTKYKTAIYLEGSCFPMIVGQIKLANETVEVIRKGIDEDDYDQVYLEVYNDLQVKVEAALKFGSQLTDPNQYLELKEKYTQETNNIKKRKYSKTSEFEYLPGTCRHASFHDGAGVTCKCLGLHMRCDNSKEQWDLCECLLNDENNNKSSLFSHIQNVSNSNDQNLPECGRCVAVKLSKGNN